MISMIILLRVFRSGRPTRVKRSTRDGNAVAGALYGALYGGLYGALFDQPRGPVRMRAGDIKPRRQQGWRKRDDIVPGGAGLLPAR